MCHTGTIAYGICQAECASVVAACYVAGGATWGATLGATAPATIAACNAAFGPEVRGEPTYRLGHPHMRLALHFQPSQIIHYSSL